MNSIRLFVLDEADKLLEESFKTDINYIFNKLPEHKQVIATSATYSDSLRALLLRYMKTPAHVKPHRSAVLIGISHHLALVDHHPHTATLNINKLRTLLHILTKETFKQCLIFCNYQIRAQHVCKFLQQNGWPAACLSGLQTQHERLETLEKLQKFACRIVVATDLAARGLDAHNVDLVINSEVPRDMATYLHRIGRCGRYGSLGKGITIVSEQEKITFEKFLSAINSECNIYIWNSSQNDNVSSISKTCKSNSNKTLKWKSFTTLVDSFDQFNNDGENNSTDLKEVLVGTKKDDIYSEKNCLLNNYLHEMISNLDMDLCEKPTECQMNVKTTETVNKNFSMKKQRRENIVNKKSLMKCDKVYNHSNDYKQWRTQLDSRIHQIQTYIYMFSLLNSSKNI